MTVKTYSGSDTIRIGARVTGGTNSYAGYFVSVTSTGAWSIIRIDNGNPVTLASGVTQTLASGDKLAIRIVGSTITAFHYTSGGGWAQVLSYDTSADSTRYTAAGSLAVEFKTSTIDDFGGGTDAAVAAPANVSLPTIAGASSATVGQQLTASPGSWTGSPAPTFSYAWQLCDSAGGNCQANGATGASYTPVSGDAGSTLAVVVTATNSAGSAAASSDATAVVQTGAVAPANVSLPTIAGASSATVGQQLTASPGSWTGSPAPTFSYAWQLCDSAGGNCQANGATGASYTPVSGDAGSTLAVVVTATNSAGSAAASSDATAVVQTGAVAPANVSLPTIAGASSATVGQQLTASPGSWTGSPAPTFSYAWQLCDSAGGNCQANGATGASYTPVSGDAGSTLAVVVTATNSAGSAAASSDATAVVQTGAIAPANVSLPTIAGASSATVGQQLTASPGSWTGSPAPTFSYAWQLCDSAGGNCQANGATGASYTPVSGDAGSTLAVVVTATNSVGSAAASSDATAVVQTGAIAPANVSLPTIAGASSATVGQQLTASPGSWTGSPAPTFSYAWQLCDSAGGNCQANGATGASYTPVSGDAGSTLAVVVTATNSAGSAAASSDATAVVQTGAIFPVTPVLDDFNRANGGAGANWSLIRPTGFATMKISGNAATSSTTQYAWNYWNPASYGPDSEAYVTVKTYSGSDVIRIGARVTGGGTNSYSGYFVGVSTAGAWSILRVDNGGNPVTLASGVTQTLASGDKLAIRIVGSTITAFHYTSGGGWAQVLSYDTSADSTRYTAAGSLAVEFKTSTIDDFGGGTLP